MKLSHVEIKNFRSIKEIKVEFSPQGRVLVGINESGKSNILKALALLSNNFSPVRKNDLREALPDEKPIDDSYVRFIFKFEKEETDKLFEIVSRKIVTIKINPEIISDGNKIFKLKEFCSLQNEGLYSVNILTEVKDFRFWSISDKHKLVNGWKKITNSCPPDYIVEIKEKRYQLSQYKMIKAEDFNNIPDNFLEDADISDFESIIGDAIIEITKKNLPDTLFWEYNPKNLLPNSVIISTFTNNPKTCIPLQNMFYLAGYENIKDSIEDIKKGTLNQFQNYLDRIASKTTDHFRKVWKEYKNVEFSLKLSGENIFPGIKEKNTLDFDRRSDGFKRFVTFLLLISVNVKMKNIRNTLILIDDPDTSLHPMGARYLRDELIRISHNNYVVYSSHSIFMIDSSDISRHYIVKKKDEITTIETAKDSNVSDEEVLYNALGYSVFNIIKENNIIFEGWRDKHLFQIYLENATEEIKTKFKNIGFCHAKGASNIKTITPMIELADRKCLILSDSDKPAKEEQKYYKQIKGYGTWKNYQDVDGSIEAITGEDFLKNDYIEKQIQSIFPAFNKSRLPNKKGKIGAMQKWITENENGLTTQQVNDKIKEIKDILFDNLKYEDIDEEYDKMFSKILLLFNN